MLFCGLQWFQSWGRSAMTFWISGSVEVCKRFPGVSKFASGCWQIEPELWAKFPVLLKSAEQLGLHQLVRNHLKLSISFPVSDPLPRHPMAFLVHLRWKHGELHLHLPASAETSEQAHHVRQVWRQTLLEKWSLGPRHEAQQWQWRSSPMQMRGELAQIDLEAARKAMESTSAHGRAIIFGSISIPAMLHKMKPEESQPITTSSWCRWPAASLSGAAALMCDPKLRNRKNKKNRWRSDNWRRQEPNKNE